MERRAIRKNTSMIPFGLFHINIACKMRFRLITERSGLIVAFFLLSGLYVLNAQPVKFAQRKADGLYKNGETIEFYALFDKTYRDSLNIVVLKNNKTELLSRAFVPETDSMLIYSGTFDMPCSVMLLARYKGGFGGIGSFVDPELVRPGMDTPSDFDRYWKSQKKALQKMNWNVTSVKVTGANVPSGYLCDNVEINCPGPKPARGYYARPEGAAPGSLPAVLLVHAAGVKGSWCRSEVENAMRYAARGAICFDLNAHGMLNSQPDDYYDQLEKGELKGYWNQGVGKRDDFYFRGMYLRLLRGIEFLALQPEWDGKRLIVIGESQGGGQALAAAGLDKRVSHVVALVPAMCDWYGSASDRRGGWPQPVESNRETSDDLKSSIPYFDAANLLRNSKAEIFVEIGFIDITCPPASVYAAINMSKGRKTIMGVPYRAHHQPAAGTDLDRAWQEAYYKPREEFISNFLK